MNRWVFSLCRNVVIFPTYLTKTGSEFHKDGAASKKNSTSHMCREHWKQNVDKNPSCLWCPVGVSSECKYAGCLDESA